jgi:hypothetical protein
VGLIRSGLFNYLEIRKNKGNIFWSYNVYARVIVVWGVASNVFPCETIFNPVTREMSARYVRHHLLSVSSVCFKHNWPLSFIS